MHSGPPNLVIGSPPHDTIVSNIDKPFFFAAVSSSCGCVAPFRICICKHYASPASTGDANGTCQVDFVNHKKLTLTLTQTYLHRGQATEIIAKRIAVKWVCLCVCWRVCVSVVCVYGHCQLNSKFVKWHAERFTMEFRICQSDLCQQTRAGTKGCRRYIAVSCVLSVYVFAGFLFRPVCVGLQSTPVRPRDRHRSNWSVQLTARLRLYA